MLKADVEAELFSKGFIHKSTSGIGHEYSATLEDGSKVIGYASIEGVQFFGPPADPNNIERVVVRLEQGGTTYRFYSIAALSANLAPTLTALIQVAKDPDLLKCPECGTRNVHLKEPSPGGKQFKPFLSCEGMMMQGSGKRRGIACYGISTKLPPLVEFA